MKLLEALHQLYPDSSRRTLQSWIKWGRVEIEGIVIQKPHHPIEPDQKITISKKERTVENISILYEDRYCIVINKPAGLLSVPAENDLPSALTLLQPVYSVSAVHRIDQDTTGTLLFARGAISEDKFDKMFEEHLLEREYLAIVEGNIPDSEGTWVSYLREKANFDVEVTSPEQGKRAVTHYQVTRRSKNFTYLRLRLETGRKHQIRVQCKEAGYPVLGDRRYGSLNKLPLCLHAHRLAFVHPFTNKKIEVIAPVPSNFKKFGSFS